MPIYVGAGFIWVHSQSSENTVYAIDPALDQVAGEGDSPAGHVPLFP